MAEGMTSRVLTLVFSDVVDSTALKAEKGDDAAAAILARHRSLVQSLARESKGRVIDWAGDGCFLTFETPSAGVRFALMLQQAHNGAGEDLPKIRVGVHMGEVNEHSGPDGETRVEGLAVDIASRIESFALPGQILMSVAVYESARQRLNHMEFDALVVWNPHGAYTLKGFDEPMLVGEMGMEGISPFETPPDSDKARRTAAPSDVAGKTGLFATGRPRWIPRTPLGIAGIGLALAALVSMGFIMYRSAQRTAKQTWARETALPEINRLREGNNYVEAFALATEAQEIIPNDPLLTQYMNDISNVISIHTTPPGASVSYRTYDESLSDWIEVGESPIEGKRLPLGDFRWRIQKDGYEDRLVVDRVRHSSLGEGPRMDGTALLPDYFTLEFKLYEVGEVPEGMIPVETGQFIPGLNGLPVAPISLNEFFIDKYEVTNKEYKDFVDRGGYDDLNYWIYDFRKGDEVVPWPEAKKHFMDSTGRPGPAGWEVGDYPEGEGDKPVAGVSWYEAAAYAKFRGKSLPTVFHWGRAAHSKLEILESLNPYIVPQSNFGGDGPASVGSYGAISASGAYDMAGNVREWCWNGTEDGRKYALGGAWNDPTYNFSLPQPQSPWDRLEVNGFRCVVYPKDSSVPATFFAAFGHGNLNVEEIPPVSDEVFQAYLSGFSYEDTPLQAKSEGEDISHGNWKEEIVTINATYNNERVILHLRFPTAGTPPYKAVVYFPGLNSVQEAEFSQHEAWEPLSHIPKSGRVLVSPVLSGMFERGGGPSQARLLSPISGAEMVGEWVRDLGRTIDYLETRSDVDTEGLAYMGLSLGAVVGPTMVVAEDRFDLAIFLSVGLSPFTGFTDQPSVSQLTYLPRITVPTLVLSGKYDYLFPVETHLMPFYELIGTPEKDKHLVIYDAGHVPLPRTEVIKETLAWLDKYQGKSRDLPQ